MIFSTIQTTTINDETVSALNRLLSILKKRPIAYSREVWSANVNDPNYVLVISQAEDGTIIGMAALCIYTNFGQCGVIHNVVVDGSCRGAGVGTKLMNTVLEIARSRNLRRIELTSRADRNTRSFYEGLGFEVVDTDLYRHDMI